MKQLIVGLLVMVAVSASAADVVIVTTNVLRDVELNFGYITTNSLALTKTIFDQMDPANAGVYTKARFQAWAKAKIAEVLRQEAIIYMREHRPSPPDVQDASTGVVD